MLEFGMKSIYIWHKISFILFGQPQTPGTRDRALGPRGWGPGTRAAQAPALL